MRKLATIRQVNSLLPIPGADNIELAVIDGWQCVTKKGTFKPGDPCVYFEIDSYLPIESRYEFLRKSSYKKLPALEGGRAEGFRLKTMTMRGALSQGLALPISEFPGLYSVADHEFPIDVTERLGVVLYEPPIDASLQGKVTGLLPSYICKTHQEQLQNHPEYLDLRVSFEVTEKLDGTSATYYYNEGKVGVCGHRWEFNQEDDNTYVEVAKKYDILDRLRRLGKNIAVQGEIVGEGIQGNPLKLKGHQFFVFDIWDIDEHRHWLPVLRRELVETLGLLHVPVLGIEKNLYHKPMAYVLEMASYASQLSTEPREGVVYKSTCLVDRRVLSFKVLSNSYLQLKGRLR